MSTEINYYNGKTKKWIREPKTKFGCKFTAFDIPNDDEIKYFIDTEWNKSQEVSENALNYLFLEVFPDNINIDKVFLKISALNDVYSTFLSNEDKTKIAKIITEKIEDFDAKIHSNNVDTSIVNYLCQLAKEDTGKYLYSFASKYCSHHKKDLYPIYDSYVDIMLKWYRDNNDVGFFFENKDINCKDYSKFVKIINDFKEKFLLQSSIKQIDQFLWSAGKIFFQKYE